MSVFIIPCPKTGQPVSTGVEVVDPVPDPGIANKIATMRCPACGQQHVWMLSSARIGEERETHQAA